MKTPTYLAEKKQVIIFKQDEIINKSRFVVKENILSLDKKDTLFIYIEDYQNRQINISIKNSSRIRIYMIIKSSKEAEYDFNFKLEESAQLDVFSALRNVEKTIVKLNLKYILAKNANLKISDALLNMGETHINESVYLEEEYSEVELDLLNIGSYNDLYVINQAIYHKAKHTISNIKNSLISNSNSKLKYSVSGRIFKGNEFSSCKQTNKGIILNEQGEIEVEPKLFIDEYNVEASHGAAIGQIDEEQLYYLLSRGLTEMEARSLIISGYTKPFINNIKDEDIKSLIERQILKRIKEADIL